MELKEYDYRNNVTIQHRPNHLLMRSYDSDSSNYTMGSTARKLQPQWDQEQQARPRILERPEPQPQPKVRVNQGIDFVSMLLLIMAIAATLVVCMNYLEVQTEVIQLNKSITTLENQITGLNKENDALEAVLDNEMYDLEYVYQIAVGVLGMVYPNNNEVIYYDNESEGYFRQYQDIPE